MNTAPYKGIAAAEITRAASHINALNTVKFSNDRPFIASILFLSVIRRTHHHVIYNFCQ